MSAKDKQQLLELIERRACPFCSVKNTAECEQLIFTTRVGQKFIKCGNCGAQGPHIALSPKGTPIDAEFNEAAEAWNRRFEDVRFQSLLVEHERLREGLVAELSQALDDLRSFVAIMCGRGPDCIIPETVKCPLGADVKIGAMMRDAETALTKARTLLGDS